MARKDRLISANALFDDLVERQFNEQSMGIMHSCYPHMRAIVVAQPTVDAAPVVHGEWIVCGDGDYVPFMCSHCGKTTAYQYKIMYGKYCPNCGAKMDGGKADEM